MPRLARIVWPGRLHHVTQRGNYKHKIFFCNQDRVVYLKYIEEYAAKYGVVIYAYCLMDNHVHFIVKPTTKEALAKVFRLTHQRYSLYINKRLDEFGHRFQSRFYSCVLIGDHIQKAIRYVENNPVRARMVANPWDYVWSSAQAHLGKKYKAVSLGDIKEYITTKSWKQYLLEGEREKELNYLRQSTLQGKVFGPLDVVKRMQEAMKQQLLPRSRGGRTKGTDTFKGL